MAIIDDIGRYERPHTGLSSVHWGRVALLVLTAAFWIAVARLA